MPADRIYVYGKDFREVLSLRDGTTITLRLGRASDKEMLRRGFEALSSESRYKRFLMPKDSLSEAELDYLSDMDGDHHFALGAVHQGVAGEEGAGVGRFVRLRDTPQVAEPAVVVVDAFQGKGLGSILLSRLIGAAKERGITRFQCSVLAQNEAMRHILEASDAEISREEVGAGLVEVTLDLPDTSSLEAVRDSSLHRILSHVAGGSTAISLGRRLLAVLPFRRHS